MTINRKQSRIIILIGVNLILIYVLACTYLWARQGHFIFMPQREIKKTPGTYRLPYEDIYVSVENPEGQEERIHAWWIPAQTPSGKSLLYLHGSAINIGANVDHVHRFYNLGFDVFIVSYRGYGLSDGPFPSEDQVYIDAEAAWDYLVGQRKIEPDHIFIYGHSIGGAIAIDLAVRHPDAAGLIVEATFTSIIGVARLNNKYRVFPLDLIVHQRFDSLAKVVDIRIPVLFIHGTDDQLIPSEMSRLLYARAPHPKRLIFINGGGHNNSASVGGEDYLRSIREFVEFVRQKT
jgi:pimeloyl-ACP methyl ester carboxylesterase